MKKWLRKNIPSMPLISTLLPQFLNLLSENLNSIAYPYNMNIFSHLYILILRMREGEIDREEIIEGLDEEEQHLIEQHQEFYQIAQQVIEKSMPIS